jgi:hypothetical protein
VIDFLAVLSLFIEGFPIGVICFYDFGLLLFPLGLFAFMTLDYCCFHWGFTIHGKTVPQFF